MPSALLDTNQLVSSLLSVHGPQAALIDAWRRRAFVLLWAPGQPDEVADVLARPKITLRYGVRRIDRDAFVDLLRIEGVGLPDAVAPGICRDRDDDYLLGCAVAGGADYLVTGDHDLLAVRSPVAVRIVTAQQFLAVLERR